MISAAPFIDFSPPLSFASTLSLSISLFDQSFHFENVDRIFHCARLRNTVSARSRQRHRPCFLVSSCYFAPLKYAKHSPLPSKREIPSIRAYAHTSRMQIREREREREKTQLCKKRRKMRITNLSFSRYFIYICVYFFETSCFSILHPFVEFPFPECAYFSQKYFLSNYTVRCMRDGLELCTTRKHT